MPKITRNLIANYLSITRPVSFTVAKDVMAATGIPLDTPLLIPGEFDQIKQPSTELGLTDNVKFDSNTRLYATVKEDLISDQIFTIITKESQEPPVLDDRKLGISIRPIYMPTTMTITFKYTCATQYEAIGWRDSVVLRQAEGRTGLVHQVGYDIPIDDYILLLLANIHTLRENIAGYGDSLFEYIKSIEAMPLSVLSTISGTTDGATIVRHEDATLTGGYFDFSSPPKEEKVSDNSTWEIEFTYNFMYRRCVAWYIVYPLMIHQQHIPLPYFDPVTKYGTEDLIKYGNIGANAFDVFDGYVNNHPTPGGYIRIPSYDEWTVQKEYASRDVKALVSWMISLNPADPQEILSLHDLPDMKLSISMTAYLEQYSQGLVSYGDGPLCLSLYVDNSVMRSDILSIDSDLNVRSSVPLDLRKPYHVRLEFITNYSLLSENAILSMQKNPYATLEIFQSVRNDLDVQEAMKHLVRGKYLSRDYIKWFYSLFDQIKHTDNGKMHTVLFLTIATQRKV